MKWMSGSASALPKPGQVHRGVNARAGLPQGARLRSSLMRWRGKTVETACLSLEFAAMQPLTEPYADSWRFPLYCVDS
jgi:hypothetical protein